MDNNQDIDQHIFIGIAVASVLLQTRRYGKAIELFNECLVLLEKHASEMIDSRRSALTTLVYERLYSLYFLVGDRARAFQSGEKACAIHLQSGNIDGAEAFLAKQKRFVEGMLLVRNGIKFKSDFDYSQAKDSFERALKLWKEIGNRREEGITLTLLGDCLMLSRNTSTRNYFLKELW